jgi:hypothetical protein
VLSTVSRSSVELRVWLTSPRACSSWTERLSEPGVLDSDGRLVGEGLQQGDLALGERPHLLSVDDDHAEELVRPEHGDSEDGPIGVHMP